MPLAPHAELRLGSVPDLMQAAPDQESGWLDDDEKRRLAVLGPERLRSEFLAGHWLVRCLAADVLGGEPAQWKLGRRDDGAPQLQAPRGVDAKDHSISISHCAGRVAVALAPFPIGVDVEKHKQRNFDGLAALAFPSQVRLEISGADGCLREQLFYSHWTIKEAVAKRDGHGIWRKLEGIHPPLRCAAHDADVFAWQFDGFSLAVAGRAGMTVRLADHSAAASHWRTDCQDEQQRNLPR